MTLFFLLSACAHEAKQGAKNVGSRCEPSAAAIRVAIDRLISADNARDLPQVMSSYTNDVILLPPSGEEVTGRDAVETRYRNLFADHTMRIRMEIAETHLGDQWAFIRGTTQGTLTRAGSGEHITLNDRFLALLQCDGDAWRISRLMWHPAQAR